MKTVFLGSGQFGIDSLNALLGSSHSPLLVIAQPPRPAGLRRRKLEIARAMVTEPSLILLDEPFSGVDPITVEDLQKEIKRLVSSGVSILITDHNVERTLEVVDKAYIIDHGQVIGAGKPSEIVRNETVRKHYLGSIFAGDEFDDNKDLPSQLEATPEQFSEEMQDD